MRKQQPTDEYNDIFTKLKQLDQDIPVPYAATAEGLKPRMASSVPARPFPAKMVLSFASLALVSIIGLTVYLNAGALFGAGSMNMKQNDEAALLGDQPPTDVYSSAYGDAAKQNSDKANFNPVTGGGGEETQESKANVELGGTNISSPATGGGLSLANNLKSAETISQIENIVADLSVVIDGAGGKSNPGRGGGASVNAFTGGYTLSRGDYDYTINAGADGYAEIAITRYQNGQTVSLIHTDCYPAYMHIHGNTLIVSGQTELAETELLYYDVTNPKAPALQRTVRQQGSWRGIEVVDDSVLLTSSYELPNDKNYLPVIYDSTIQNNIDISPQRVLYTEECQTPVYTIITLVPMEKTSDLSYYAVLGGGEVSWFGLREFYLQSAYTSSAFSLQDGQMALVP